MQEPDYKNICTQVRRIAKEAGEFIRKERKNFTPDKIEKKGEHDLVSYVDRGAEKIIVGQLRPLIKGARFLTEEGSSSDIKQNAESPYCWIIDPLDGTTNFTHSLPPYCVCIALAENDQIVVGVVYEVTQKECFYAWKDSKAYMNGKIIRVSETDILKDSLIATGFSYNSTKRLDEFNNQMNYFLKYTHGARRIGSAAADLVYVGAGRFDAFSQFNLSPWDVAAASLIVERAGGRVSDYKGGNNFIFGKEIVATNPYLYKEYMDIIHTTTSRTHKNDNPKTDR